MRTSAGLFVKIKAGTSTIQYDEFRIFINKKNANRSLRFLSRAFMVG